MGMGTNKKTLVSVIVPVYNGDRYIAQAIESILDQTYTNCEIIVVDDGSTDRTYSVLQPYLDNICYIYQGNQGVSAARNYGIQIAQGEFIAFLDQDDFFLPTKIADQIACFEAQPSLGIIHAGWRMVNECREAICDSTPWHYAPDLNLETWLLHNPTLPSAMMFRRSWLIKANGFDLRFPPSADTHLVLRLLLMGCSVAWLKQVVVCYRTHANNTSKDFINHAKASCAVRDDFFARADLPDNIRQIEKPVRYKHFVHHAWRLYNAGYFEEMSQYLQKSLRFAPCSPVDTIRNWIETFVNRSPTKDFQGTQSSLESIKAWQELVDYVRSLDRQLSLTNTYSTEQSPQTEVVPNLAFITCIEAGVLEAQSLLLYESIRQFTGVFSQCPIYAISPRTGYTVSPETKRCLERLSVEYIDIALTSGYDFYPQSNKAFAAGYIEEKAQHEILVHLDSDTLFLSEPKQFWLPKHIDVGVRPVDVKGICTSGTMDEFDRYWHLLCQTCNVNYDCLPWLETVVDRINVKACYNGGLSVVRANKGIFRQWQENFVISMRQGLEPRTEEISITTATGTLQSKGSRVFNSIQSTLSLAIWGLTEKVQIFAPSYNYPLHLHDQIPPGIKANNAQDLIHVHYHWMFNSGHLEVNPLLQSEFHLDDRIHAWLIERIPLDRKDTSQNRNLSGKPVNRLKQVLLDLERSHSRLEQIKLDIERSKNTY